MKTYFHSLILLSLLFLLAACSEATDPAEEQNADWTIPLEVHLQANFENDLVRVELDRKVIFNDRATTGALLGFAERLKLKRDSGTHSLRVVVNNNVLHEESFDLQDTLYIGVGYVLPINIYVNRKEIKFRFSEEPFRYD